MRASMITLVVPPVGEMTVAIVYVTITAGPRRSPKPGFLSWAGRKSKAARLSGVEAEEQMAEFKRCTSAPMANTMPPFVLA